MEFMTSGKGRRRLFPTWLALSAAGALLAIATMLGSTRGGEAQSASMIGVDVIPDTNQPSRLGALETCASADSGDRFAVDVFINNVDALTKWEARVEYDSGVLSLEEVDYNHFLVSAPPGGSVFPTLFDSESEGRYFLAAAEVQSAPDSGSGTLARLTMRALGGGRSVVRVVHTPEYLGPQLSGVGGAPVGDSTGDAIWDGDYLEGEVVVDGDCEGDSPVVTPKPDPAPQPTRTPTSGGNGSGSNSSGGTDGSSGNSDSVTSGEQVVLIGEDGELLPGDDGGESVEDGGEPGEDSSDSSSEDGSAGGDGSNDGGNSEDGSEPEEEGRLGIGQSPTPSGDDDTGWIVLGFAAAATLVIAGIVLYSFARRRL